MFYNFLKIHCYGIYAFPRKSLASKADSSEQSLYVIGIHRLAFVGVRTFFKKNKSLNHGKSLNSVEK